MEIISVFEKKGYGIARYPLEEAAYFQKRGYPTIRVGITPASDAEMVFDLTTFPGALKWLGYGLKKKSRAVSFHYYDGLAFPSISRLAPLRWLGRMMQALALGLLGRSSSSSRVMIHELPFGSSIGTLRRLTTGFALSQFKRIEFFTDVVRQRALSAYPLLRPEQAAVVDHDRYMESMEATSRSAARAELALQGEKIIFLCIGWWAPQKGFPMAMQAFAASAASTAELWIVGDVPAVNEQTDLYKKQIQEFAEQHENIHTRNEYVSDAAFDLWLRAANFVVLPYVSSTNSGVGARAKVAGCGLIVKELETLRAQFPDALVFDTPEQLGEIFRKHSAEGSAESRA